MASKTVYLILWLIVALEHVFAKEETELEFTEEPHDAVVLKSQPFLLNCSAISSEGQPPNITWRHDGYLVNDARRWVLSNGSLYFKRVIHRRKGGRSDEGIYECVARNSVGAIVSSRARLKIAVIERNSGSYKKKMPEEGEQVRFQCHIQAVPTPTVTWQKDGMDINFQDQPRHIMLPSGVLQITGVLLSDSGAYKCRVENLAGVRFSREQDLEVQAADPAVTKPPQMLVGAQHIKKVIGDSAVLECAAGGLPLPTVTWTKDGMPIENARVHKVGHGNLEITSLKLSDTGTYICTAAHPDNPDSAISLKTKLNVLEPPTLMTEPRRMVSAYMAKTVRIECQFGGMPEPNITWLKNGQVITHSPKRHHPDSTWLISHADLIDSGYYQCRGENEAGMAQRTIQLYIFPSANAPDKPQGVRAETTSSTSIQVSWTPVPVKNGRQILAYSVHYIPVKDGSELQKVVRTTSVDLTRLWAYTNYSIYVVAYNNESASQHSDSIYQMTGEDVPLEAPKLRVTKIGASSLKLEWDELPVDKACGVITQYQIHYRAQGASKPSVTVEQGVHGSLEYILTGLQPHTRYDIRVLAGTKVGFPDLGEEDWPWVTGVTSPQYSGALEPPVLQVHALNATAVQARWHPVNQQGIAITGYKLDVINTRNVIIKTLIFTRSKQNATIAGLLEDTFYKVSVRCIGYDREAEATVRDVKTLKVGDEAVLPTSPAPPQDLEAIPMNDTTIRLHWRRPLSTKGVIYYTIRYKPLLQLEDMSRFINDTFIKHQAHPNNVTLEAILTRLRPFTLYEFAVRTHTSEQFGPYSNVVRCRTHEGRPSEPLNLQLTLRGPGIVELTWQPPVHRNGVIVQYIIAYKEEKKQDQGWVMKKENGSVTMSQVDNLELDAIYLFRMQAATSAGIGPPSPIRNLHTRNPRPDVTHLPGLGEQSGGRDQEMGIIVGVCIGGACIIICIIIILLRNRCFPPRQLPGTVTTATTMVPTETTPGQTIPEHFNGTTYIPNANGNGFIQSAGLLPVTAEGDELETLTPMLPILEENEHSDSKGGYGVLNGIVPLSGLRVQYLPNGQVATFLTSQESSDEHPQVPPRSTSLSKGNNGIDTGTNPPPRTPTPNSNNTDHNQPNTVSNNIDRTRHDTSQEETFRNLDLDDIEVDYSASSSLERNSTSSQSQPSQCAPTQRQDSKKGPGNSPVTGPSEPIQGSPTCGDGEGDLDASLEESEVSRLLSQPPAPPPPSQPHRRHAHQQQSSSIEYASSPPQSRLGDHSAATGLLPNDADTSGSPLLSCTAHDDSVHFSSASQSQPASGDSSQA